MVVRGTEAVEKFFPVIDQHCSYFLGVSAACLVSTSMLHPCSIALDLQQNPVTPEISVIMSAVCSMHTYFNVHVRSFDITCAL